MWYLDKISANSNSITKDKPWQSQLFILWGTETLCFAVLRDSRLALYTCCLMWSAGRDAEVLPFHVVPRGQEWRCSIPWSLKDTVFVASRVAARAGQDRRADSGIQQQAAGDALGGPEGA